MSFTTNGRTGLLAALRSGAVAMLFVGGCGELAPDDAPENVTKRTGAIRCYDAETGQPNPDPQCPWRTWAQLTPDNPSLDITHKLAPAMCVRPGAPGFLTITVDNATGSYRTLQWTNLGKGPNWGGYGPRAFVSKPTCAFREDFTADRPGFVLAGKSTDNKIYASPGIMAAFSMPQQNPAPVSGTPGQFAAVSSTVYSASTTAGSPALAGRAGSTVVLAAMANDSRTVFVHYRDLPYLSNSWSGIITGPTLPSGWTASGPPSITTLPVTFHIVVHAQNGTSHRLFETHFFRSSNIAHFSNGIGSPASAWTMLPSMGSMASSTGISFTYLQAPINPVNGYETVYFLSGGVIKQTSSPLGQLPVLSIPAPGLTFSSEPAAAAGFPFEAPSEHMVVARAGSKLHFLPGAGNPPGYIGP